MEYKTYNFDAYKIHTCKTDRFKDCVLEVITRRKYEEKDFIKRVILGDVLMDSSKKYCDRMTITRELDDKYGTALKALTSIIGYNVFNNYIYGFVNPKYVNNEISLEESLKLPFELLFNPNVKNDMFVGESFDIIKSVTRADTLSTKESPNVMAFKNYISLMDKDCPLIDHIDERLQAIDDLTPQELYDYYEECLDDSLVDIFVVGNIDMDSVVNVLKRIIPLRSIKTEEIDFIYKMKCHSKTIVAKEDVDIPQSRIYVGLVPKDMTNLERSVVALIYNYILGGNSIESKLGDEVRVKNSLCYHIGSSYSRNFDFMTIQVSLAKENVDKTVKLIKKVIKDMTNKVTIEELDKAKKSFNLSFDSINDSNTSILNHFVFQVLDNRPSLDELKKLINDVTLEQIQEFAKKVEISVIYKSLGKGDE